MGGKAKMQEDVADGLGLGDKGEDSARAFASRAGKIGGEHAFQEVGPGQIAGTG